MAAPICTDDFGVDGFRSKMTEHGGILTIAHRGWLAGVVFIVIAAVLAYIIRAEKFTFSGTGILMYLGAGLAFLVGILYAIYIEEISFDTNREVFRLRHGFWGIVQASEVPFAEISNVTVREERMTHSNPGNPTTTTATWHLDIKCESNQPTFDFWQACDQETALHIANTLADTFGCEVSIEEWGI